MKKIALLSILLLTISAIPAMAEEDLKAWLVGDCTAEEGDAAYCQCTVDLLYTDLTQEEIQLFADMLKAEKAGDQAKQEEIAQKMNMEKMEQVFGKSEEQCRTK